MTKHEIITLAEKFVLGSAGNYISEKNALSPDYVGMKIFDSPIFAFGSPDDEIYLKYKSADVIGSHFLLPQQWLEGAKTVVSFFLPYNQRVKSANSAHFDWPADEWLHARYEGQLFLKELLVYLQSVFADAGAKSIISINDEKFKSGNNGNRFTSNWSERHAAYACGLGTFGLSKGLITEKGVCGRYGSIITELNLPKDVRRYTGIYDYCNMCGMCIKNCPANAISAETGKNDLLCSDFLDNVHTKNNPRYGCGKCQVGVPCESGVPK